MAMAALLTLTACAQATGDVPAPTPALARQMAPVDVVQRLPAQLAGFRRSGEITDYEATPRGAGLGASATYRPASGLAGIATVYVYDGFVPPRVLPPGPSASDLDLQFRNSLAEIQALAPVRQYRIASIADASPAPGPDGQPALRCQRLLLASEGGGSDSYLCIGVVTGRFLKLRVTLPIAPAGGRASAPAPGQRDREVLAFGAAAVAAVTQASGYRSAGAASCGEAPCMAMAYAAQPRDPAAPSYAHSAR